MDLGKGTEVQIETKKMTFFRTPIKAEKPKISHMGVDYYMPPANLAKVRNEEASVRSEENEENVNPAQPESSGTRANAPDSLVALYGIELVASIYNVPFYQNLPL